MAIEDADCVGVQRLQLVIDNAVLARSIGFILHTLDPISHDIFLEMERRRRRRLRVVFDIISILLGLTAKGRRFDGKLTGSLHDTGGGFRNYINRCDIAMIVGHFKGVSLLDDLRLVLGVEQLEAVFAGGDKQSQ